MSMNDEIKTSYKKSDHMTGPNGLPFPKEYLYACVGPGWTPLLKGLLRQLFDKGWDGVVHQVKEKFGGLRFYIGNGSEEIYRIISLYENKSREICEECGEPGMARGGGWIKTLCDKHAGEREEFKPFEY
jgi:hypothetical protein